MRRLCAQIIFTTVLAVLSSCESSIPTLPTIHLSKLDSVRQDEMQSSTCRITAHGETLSMPIRIRRRGGSSIKYPKHSFEIDLITDVPLLGLPSDDDWVLLSNYIDKTFIRHALAYDLFTAMSPNNEAAQYAYTSVYIDDDFRGLYLFMEKLDASSLGIVKSDTTAFVFKEPTVFRKNIANINPQKPDNVQQQVFPDIQINNKTHVIDSIRHFISNSSDEDFQNNFQSVFDLDNILDWHILLLLSNNSDGILKNFYLYKVDKFTPIRIAPWDYDHAFGRDGDNELNIRRKFINLRRSLLFDRLLDKPWYMKLLNDRWHKLIAKNIISEQAINGRITEYAAKVAPHIDGNAAVWPVDGPYYYDANNFDQEVDVMREYLDVRFDSLHQYFEKR